MTEESSSNQISNSTASSDHSQSRQRKKRKWDQPAESLVSAGVVLPLPNIGSLHGISFPGGVLAPFCAAASSNALPVANSASVPTVFQVLHVPQINPKSNQLKVQDELIIAREIVINDAEASVRYRLTKRQTQEEIQKLTGAVVITRGKYRPPNAPPGGEKPLYLHISSGAHLKDTAERILSVDLAAAMVEEMLKQGPNLQPAPSVAPVVGGSGVKALSTCVFLGFDADESLNLAARIRGPNDQYINHIMNETGATVVLKGRGSGNFELPDSGAQQPLHLFISANTPSSLENAKRLAENLLDTISLECGASRISSNKVYGAVPPPQQLLSGIQSSGVEQKVNTYPGAGVSLSTTGYTVPTPASSVAIHGTTPVFSQGVVYPSGGLVNCGPPQPTLVSHPQQPLVNVGTSYSGYDGIYPQVTPLQQVALALRQSTSPITSTIAPATSAPSTSTITTTTSIPDKEKRAPQRRKFQELPIGSKDPANFHQVQEPLKPADKASANGLRNTSTLPAPRKLVQFSSNEMPPPPPPPPQTMPLSSSVNGMPPPPQQTLSPPKSNGMPPPPYRTMPPPPPPPKFGASKSGDKQHERNISNKSKSESVPVVSDTLAKLVAYGDDDDDDDLDES